MEYLLADLYKERMGKGSGERGGRGNGSGDHKKVGWRNEWGIVGSELGGELWEDNGADRGGKTKDRK